MMWDAYRLKGVYKYMKERGHRRKTNTPYDLAKPETSNVLSFTYTNTMSFQVYIAVKIGDIAFTLKSYKSKCLTQC